MNIVLTALVALCLAIPSAPLACSRVPMLLTGPPPRPDAEAIAAELLDRAASVQLVKITRTQVISYRDLYRLAGAPWDPAASDSQVGKPVLRTFKTSQRLKGVAPAEFTLVGAMQGYDLAQPPPGSGFRRITPSELSERFTFNPEGSWDHPSTILELSPEYLYSAICQTYIYGLAGQQFLVFLDADYRLLREDGPVFSYIETPDDPWLAIVRQVAANRGTGSRK